MASIAQYQFFKELYAEENTRYNELTKKAEVYFSIVSLFLSAVLFKFNDVSSSIGKLHNVCLIIGLSISLIAVGIALLLLIYSLKIRKYEGTIDMEEYIGKNKTYYQEDGEFYEDRIADFIVAIDRNTETNNKRADLLTISTYFIVAGLLFLIAFFIYFFTLNK